MKNLFRAFRLEDGLTPANSGEPRWDHRMMISLFERWMRDPSLALTYRLADALGK
jgi:hypothetical protein